MVLDTSCFKSRYHSSHKRQRKHKESWNRRDQGHDRFVEALVLATQRVLINPFAFSSKLCENEEPPGAFGCCGQLPICRGRCWWWEGSAGAAIKKEAYLRRSEWNVTDMSFLLSRFIYTLNCFPISLSFDSTCFFLIIFLSLFSFLVFSAPFTVWDNPRRSFWEIPPGPFEGQSF